MRIRPALPGDLPDIHKRGYDAWGEGCPEPDYIEQCMASEKYKKGHWYVLEDDNGLTVSSLIYYKNAFGMEEGSAGIGSVTTSPDQRLKGYASRLVQGITGLLIGEKVKHIFLYSDIDPSFYERLGFHALGKEQQKHLPSVCMVLHASQNPKHPDVPSYF